MSYNPNFYNNFRPEFTFHNYQPNYIPPPPPPPFFNTYIPPPPQINDQEFVKQYEKPITKPASTKPPISINQIKETLKNLVLNINSLKEKEIFLKQNLSTMPEEQWATAFDEIEKNKSAINDLMSQINDKHLDMLRKLLAKRSAKRLRLKRLKVEKKKEKEIWIKEREERSRKIDENLQKIKDEIEKAKQEEEAKLQADVVLREVLRKKQDAKKSIAKLEALLKLYKARQNTAKGRGETVSEANAATFNSVIEKLKTVWTRKLKIYEQEECELRATLKRDDDKNALNEQEMKVTENLDKWRGFLFGGMAGPQADFQGDVGRFVAVRSQWDQFINNEGSSLPIGWVVPNINSV